MTRLIHSAKFMTALIDVVISLTLYFIGKYAAPSTAEDIKTVILGLQPIFGLVIAGMAYEDGQAKRALVSNGDLKPQEPPERP